MNTVWCGMDIQTHHAMYTCKYVCTECIGHGLQTEWCICVDLILRHLEESEREKEMVEKSGCLVSSASPSGSKTALSNKQSHFLQSKPRDFVFLSQSLSAFFCSGSFGTQEAKMSRDTLEAERRKDGGGQVSDEYMLSQCCTLLVARAMQPGTAKGHLTPML